MNRFIAAVTVVLTLLSSQGLCQIPRYELGKRVKRFERRFEPVLADGTIRTQVLPHLQAAVSGFFSLRATVSCRELDQASLKISQGQPPSLAMLALLFEPERRLIDTDATELFVKIRPMYGDRPEKSTTVHVMLIAPDGTTLGQQAATTNDESLTVAFKALPEGDYTLISQVGRFPLSKIEQTISVVRDVGLRLTKLESAVKQNDPDRTQAITGYVRDWARQIRLLQRNQKPETDIPAHALLVQLETWMATGNRAMQKSGSRMVLTAGRKTLACRVRLCEDALKGKATPVVIALHGAGGSENMFYETYGAGKIVDLCEKRGWVLVCPRISSFFGLAFSTEEMLQSLESQGVTIDRSAVLVVGHSMGVGAAMSLARQETKLAAVAALGGGGSSAVSKSNSAAPFYVAAGDQDFGRTGAAGLARGLKRRGVETLFRIFKNTEHLGIVQIALDDVFLFLDDAVKK
jgi:dienelactone hydrolase